MPKIPALPPMTSPDGLDELPIEDVSVGTTKYITLTRLKEWLQALVGWVSTAMLSDGLLTNAKLNTATGELGGVWQSWTPVFSNSAGSCTVNLTYARYMKIGKTIHWRVVCNVTAASASGSLGFTAPVNAQHVSTWAGAGREDSGTGKMTEVLFKSGATVLNVLFYDNTGSSCTVGYSHIIGGSYESA